MDFFVFFVFVLFFCFGVCVSNITLVWTDVKIKHWLVWVSSYMCAHFGISVLISVVFCVHRYFWSISWRAWRSWTSTGSVDTQWPTLLLTGSLILSSRWISNCVCVHLRVCVNCSRFMRLSKCVVRCKYIVFFVVCNCAPWTVSFFLMGWVCLMNIIIIIINNSGFTLY